MQNYHGYASTVLYKMGIKSSVSEIITKFNHVKPIIEHFDVLIIDEYQDINEELATLLEWIKEVINLYRSLRLETCNKKFMMTLY